MEKVEKEMEKYGYTRENLYNKEKRTPVKVLNLYQQSLMAPKYHYEEIEPDKIESLFITGELAQTIPAEVCMRISYDDCRYLYAKDEDCFKESVKPLMISCGPGYSDLAVPHMLFESELKG